MSTKPAIPEYLLIMQKSDGELADVLLVDDNAINQLVAQQILKKAGYTCEVASSGEEAIARLGSEVYRLILMDVQMPGIDGLETTRRIRSSTDEQLNTEIPIVAMTAYSTQEDRENCSKAGMNDYLTKPLQLDGFLATVRKYLDCSDPTETGETLEGSDSQELPDQTSFDLADALARTGHDHSLVRRTVTMFLDSASERVESISSACAEGDLQKAANLAHNLQGASLNVSARHLARISTRIERAARAMDQEKARNVAAELADELERVRATVKNSELLEP